MSDQIDQMLRAAGEQWRQAQPPAPEPDSSRWSDSAVSRPRWMPIAAAAVAVAIAAAGLSALLRRAGEVPANQRAAAASTGPTALFVRDGDTVRASGLVLAQSGGPTRFCPPEVGPGVPIGNQDEPPCAHGVPVTGVDLDQLSTPVGSGSIRSGYADLTGVWQAGQLRVVQQAAVGADPVPDDDAAPCPAPGGKWRNIGERDGKDLDAYVRQHADQFGPVWLARPAGTPAGTVPTIMVVPVVYGDSGAVESALARRYGGSLCLISAPAKKSIAEQDRATAAVRPVVDQLLADPSSGVYGFGYPTSTSLQMVVLTEDLYRQMGNGLDPQPWLRPVR
jgi:hypothetical protein